MARHAESLAEPAISQQGISFPGDNGPDCNRRPLAEPRQVLAERNESMRRDARNALRTFGIFASELLHPEWNPALRAADSHHPAEGEGPQKKTFVRR